jgi:hypothetical protein
LTDYNRLYKLLAKIIARRNGRITEKSISSVLDFDGDDDKSMCCRWGN